MTSKAQFLKDKYQEGYVYIWLPNETTPVGAGKLEAQGDTLSFNYGKSYLERIKDTPPAIPIYEPELPLKAGALPNLDGLKMPRCIRDNALDELTYLLESGSGRN